MSLEAAFYAYVTANAGLSAIVGDRVYQDLMPQKEVYPAIVYSLISENRTDGMSLRGPNGHVESRLQVTCWSDVRPQSARALYDALRLAVHGYKGTWDGTTIQQCEVDSVESVVDAQPENNKARLYGYRADLLVWHVEDLGDNPPIITRTPFDAVQHIAFSAEPGYGEYALSGGPVNVTISALLDLESQIITAFGASNAPRVTSPTTTASYLIFENGIYAGVAVDQYTATANTTNNPLRNTSGNSATLTKTTNGDGVSQVNVYTIFAPGSECGSVALGSATFNLSVSGDTTGTSSTYVDPVGSAVWNIVAVTGGWELRSVTTSNIDISESLSSQQWGLPVTVAVTTTQNGG
jgi:hypothetical protein